jgi:hypothetical protein
MRAELDVPSGLEKGEAGQIRIERLVGLVHFLNYQGQEKHGQDHPVVHGEFEPPSCPVFLLTGSSARTLPLLISSILQLAQHSRGIVIPKRVSWIDNSILGDSYSTSKISGPARGKMHGNFEVE